jgi:uroporphyrinogen decarboxylase
MNHRERVLAALNHTEPDRVPRYAGLTPGIREEFRRQTGHTDPAIYWDWDIAGVGFRPPQPLPDLTERFGRYFEDLDVEWILDWEKRDFPPEWGVATRPAHLYHLSAPLSPMTTFSDAAQLEDYPFPDYVGEWRHDHLEADVEQLQDDGYFVDSHIGWIFQTAWTLRSEVRLLEDFFTNPEFADTLLTRITDIRVAQATRLAQAGVDSISMNDDIGGQRGMLISPAMWREWLKPRMQRVISAIREVNPDIYFRYHSDGNYIPVIPDLIEMGVSSLRTVQPEAMDIFDIKRRYGDEIALEGTIGLQGPLRHGEPEEIQQIIKNQCQGLMPGGGWIASPANGVTPDIPWENLAMVFKALDMYGNY